jgi:MoxR-like ATPase
VLAYCVELAAATRRHPTVEVGASPRGSLALLLVARALAVIDGRDFVLPEDVKECALPALAHRLTLRPETWTSGMTAIQVVTELLGSVPTPASTRSR